MKRKAGYYMDLLIQITFFITMYPILFLMYFLLRNAGEKTYCFGATLKQELRNGDVILVKASNGMKFFSLYFFCMRFFIFCILA